MHVLCIVGMGLYLLDNAYLERLSEACAALKRWHFFFAMGPLRLQDATGSPVNPIAIL
jgi:hypothetical protein